MVLIVWASTSGLFASGGAVRANDTSRTSGKSEGSRLDSAESTSPASDSPITDAPATHVTFGSHTTANQPCVTCHPKTPSDEIACRSCHGFDCGEDAKTVADCLKCHQTGTTDEWVAAE